MALNKKLVQVKLAQPPDQNQHIMVLKKLLEMYDNGLLTLEQDWLVGRKNTLFKLVHTYHNLFSLETKLGENKNIFYLTTCKTNIDDLVALINKLPDEF